MANFPVRKAPTTAPSGRTVHRSMRAIKRGVGKVPGGTVHRNPVDGTKTRRVARPNSSSY